MLGLSFALLLMAGVLGLGLWLAFLRGPEGGAPGWIAGLHGACGALGLAVLLLAPLPAHSAVAAHGVAGFRRIGIGLLLAVLSFGIAILWWRRRARPSPLLVGGHAIGAITALAVLAAWFGLS
ncbi:MAG: hypothetical protein KGL12_01240 [Rhodospirillales bacterium]|nr:hypothetical protein [Rhodospirillales bacterium]